MHAFMCLRVCERALSALSERKRERERERERESSTKWATKTDAGIYI
jgi:hypothetical protein